MATKAKARQALVAMELKAVITWVALEAEASEVLAVEITLVLKITMARIRTRRLSVPNSVAFKVSKKPNLEVIKVKEELLGEEKEQSLQLNQVWIIQL